MDKGVFLDMVQPAFIEDITETNYLGLACKRCWGYPSCLVKTKYNDSISCHYVSNVINVKGRKK
jgi:hypothetical protein